MRRGGRGLLGLRGDSWGGKEGRWGSGKRGEGLSARARKVTTGYLVGRDDTVQERIRGVGSAGGRGEGEGVGRVDAGGHHIAL